MRSDNPTPNLPEIHSGSAHPEGPAPSEQAAMIEALQWAKTTMQDDDRPGDSPTRRADVARHLLTLDKIYELVRGRAAVGEPSYTRSLADSDTSSHKRDALGERPAEDAPGAALLRIAKMRCQHDSEMRDICAACIAQDALGIGKPLLDALGRVPPGRDTPTGGNT